MLEVDVHLLNVEHGDSTVIRIRADGLPEKWVVIDCNTVRRGENRICPAFELLQQEGVQEVDLLVITHLHADHYDGVDKILQNLTVKKLAIPPFITQKSGVYRRDVFSKYKKQILEVAKTAGDAPAINSRLLSLATLLSFMVENAPKVVEVAGPESQLRIPGLPDPVLSVYLPLRKLKGVLIERIKDDDFLLEPFPAMNDSSVVTMLEAHGHRLLWAADSTLPQWREHKRGMTRDGISCLNSTAVKVPHHGSKHNNTSEILRYLLAAPVSGRPVLVSAEGVRRPQDEFFQTVSELQLSPYCTNLARQCRQTDTYTIVGLATLPPKVQTFLLSYRAYEKMTPCQGDITLSIRDSGMKISNSTGRPCVYDPQLRPRLKLFP